MGIRTREPVILAADFASLVKWYRDVLGFAVVKSFEDQFHYCNLEAGPGAKLGIASAKEMGMEPDGRKNTVVLQFEVDDLKQFFLDLEARGATITSGPSFDANGSFWFGSFSDPEGNQSWVVDKDCP